MLSQDFIDELSRKAAALFPAADELRSDLEAQLGTLLQRSFGRLNLVTREEFDARVQSLARCEKTIAELEAKIAELEAAQKNK